MSEFGVESSNGFVDLIPANDSRALRSFVQLICQTRQTPPGLRSRAAVCIIGARDYKFRSGANNNLLNIIFPLPRTCEKASNIVEDGGILV